MKAPPRCAIAMTILLWGMVRTVTAQTPDASLTMPVVPAVPGAEVLVPLTLTSSDPVIGFSFGVTHDPGVLTPVAIEPGNAFVASAVNFFPNLDPAVGTGVTVGAMIDGDLSPPFITLPPALPHEVIRLRYQVAPGAMIGTTSLDLSGALGNPVVPSAAVVDIGNDTPFEVSFPAASGGVTIDQTIFRRGDTNDDGGVTLPDVLTALEIMFFPIGDTSCLDAVDANDNGGLGIDDAIYLLEYLFLGTTGPPPAPFPNCGPDPTPDPLGCSEPRDVCP